MFEEANQWGMLVKKAMGLGLGIGLGLGLRLGGGLGGPGVAAQAGCLGGIRAEAERVMMERDPLGYLDARLPMPPPQHPLSSALCLSRVSPFLCLVGRAQGECAWQERSQ